MKYLALFLSFTFASGMCLAQAPVIEWQKSYGGPGHDAANTICPAPGGFVFFGHNGGDGGDVTGNHGNMDFWVTKIDDTGALLWQKSPGGTDLDVGTSLQRTFDGGYICTGWTYSNNGDVSGNHGVEDCWVLKLNDTGGIQWKKCFGHIASEAPWSIIQCSDSNYVFAGFDSLNGGDVTGNHGRQDFWVVKLNDTGGIIWQQSYGGTDYDYAYHIDQTFDRGFIVSGAVYSNDYDVSGYHGAQDIWILKLNDTGGVQWKKVLGGTVQDYARCIRQTFDSGYIVAGTSSSNDADVSGNHGLHDFWITKLNNMGALTWQKSLGGSSIDVAIDIRQTYDSGYVVAGITKSNDGDVGFNHGGDDWWIVKINDTGAIQWKKSLGGSGSDQANAIIQTTDGYLVAGFNFSIDGDVTGNHGNADAWIVKLNCNLYAGTISGASSVCMGDSILLTDTAAGGTWSTANGYASVAGGVVTGISAGNDTVFYTIFNACGRAQAAFPVSVLSCPLEVQQPGITTNISVLPNPTTGNISITGTEQAYIKIYNVVGQLIKVANNTNTVSFSEFPEGMYFIRVFNDQGMLLKQEKVIKK